MPIICWGNLAKAADDTLRIEQSISDYIEGHDENPNAHMGPDYALGAHRLQAVLDHAPDSVYPEHVNLDLSFLHQVEKTNDQNITGELQYQDVTGLYMVFSSSRAGRMLMMATIFTRLTGSEADPMFRFKVTQNSVVTYYPWEYGVSTPNFGGQDIYNNRYFPLFCVCNLEAGDVAIQVQAARSTEDETVTVKGLYEDVRSSLAILTVGSKITLA